MGAPASSGTLCINLCGMEIGDYIACKYVAPTTGKAGQFVDLGGVVEQELSTVPQATANGYFYFLKVKQNLWLADRSIQRNISYDALHHAQCAFAGMPVTGKIRTLSQAEWTEIITNSDLNGKITKQDVNVWHGSQLSRDFYMDYYKEFDILPELLADTSGANVKTALNRNGAVFNTSYHFRSHRNAGQYSYSPIWYAKNIGFYRYYPGGGYNGWNNYISFRPALEIPARVLCQKEDGSVYGMQEMV